MTANLPRLRVLLDASREPSADGLAALEQVRDELPAMLDEVEVLGKQRDEAIADCGCVSTSLRAADKEASDAQMRCVDLQRRLEAALAEHARNDSNPRVPWCGTCLCVWPCATHRLLSQPDVALPERDYEETRTA